jgi:hypothetical protein
MDAFVLRLARVATQAGSVLHTLPNSGVERLVRAMQSDMFESARAGEGGLGRRSVAQRVHAQGYE